MLAVAPGRGPAAGEQLIAVGRRLGAGRSLPLEFKIRDGIVSLRPSGFLGGDEDSDQGSRGSHNVPNYHS